MPRGYYDRSHLIVPLAERLARKTQRNGECLEWTGGRFASGYGAIWDKGQMQYTHRVAYELFCGQIPEGLQVMHTCDNRACVEPNHLVTGTNDENFTDMVNKGRAWWQKIGDRI